MRHLWLANREALFNLPYILLSMFDFVKLKSAVGTGRHDLCRVRRSRRGWSPWGYGNEDGEAALS